MDGHRTIDEGIKESDVYSGKLSDVSRQLAFSGIAIIWIVRSPEKADLHELWHPLLLAPLGFLVFALALDLFHYLSMSIFWHRWYRRAEIQNDTLRKENQPEKSDFPVSSLPINIGWWLFYSKSAVVLLAYMLLLAWFAGRLLSTG